MKFFYWTDDDGYLHRVLARDDDLLETAKRVGIPSDPPALSGINWDEVQKELHNLLIRRQLCTWAELEGVPQGTLESTILAVLRRKIVELYKSTR